MTWLLHFWDMLYESSPETNIISNLSGRPAYILEGKFAQQQQKNTCWMGCGIINYQRACVIGHGIIAVKHAMQGSFNPAACLTQKRTHATEIWVLYCHTQHCSHPNLHFISVLNSRKSVMISFRLPNSPESTLEDKTWKIQSIRF